MFSNSIFFQIQIFWKFNLQNFIRRIFWKCRKLFVLRNWNNLTWNFEKKEKTFVGKILFFLKWQIFEEIKYLKNWVKFQKLVTSKLLNFEGGTYFLNFSYIWKTRHIFSKKQVIPLPKWRVDPETCPEALYPKGATGELLNTFSEYALRFYQRRKNSEFRY